MRKIIVEAEMSLDGIINDGDFWGQVFEYHSQDVNDYLDDLLFLPDALLMGRVTYEGFAQVWPAREGKAADRINAMPKYVASRTLRAPLAWNSTLIEGDVPAAIARLKEGEGKPLLQYGLGELTETMLRHGLVDELRLLVFPFTYGKGDRAFAGGAVHTLRLVDTHTFESGVVALTYQPN